MQESKEQLARQRRDDLNRVSNLVSSAQSLAFNGFDAPGAVYDEIYSIVSNWYSYGTLQNDLFGPVRLNA